VKVLARSIGAVALLSLVFLPSVTSASHAPGNSAGPPQDFAVGGGESPFSQFSFAAHSGPVGENPRGHWTAFNRDFNVKLSGHVTCLRVVGNRAIFGVRLEQATPSFLEGQGEIVEVLDNGEPVGGQPVDLLGTLGVPTPPTVCPPFGVTVMVPFDGNIVVHDGQPRP
jgi:hypothetical protein